MKHTLIYPEYNSELLHYDIVEIDISELENPLELNDLKSKSISLCSDNETKYVRIASVRFGFGNSETYHYLIDNKFDIHYFKTGFEEARKTIKDDFDYMSSEEKREYYLDCFLISFDIYVDEENKKYMKELESKIL